VKKKASSAATTKAIAKGNSKRNAKRNAKQKMVPPMAVKVKVEPVAAVKVKVEPVDESKETDDDNDDGDDIDDDNKATLFAAIGMLHDVPAKGNCGYDALHRGLALANIDVPECPHQHRKWIFDYASENEIMLRESLRSYPKSFRTRGAWTTFFNSKVLKPIFDAEVDFRLGASMFHWMEAEYVLPIVAMRYNITLVVYDSRFKGTICYHGDGSYEWDMTSGFKIVRDAKVCLVLWNNVHYNYIDYNHD
jgi:hypothetical protein